MKKHRKIHLILGLIVLPIILLYACSGIVLNHREFFSEVDIPRTWLATSYSYEDGRQASLRGALFDGTGKRILYGDAGVWREENGEYTEVNDGFVEGADNHKIYDLSLFDGQLLAASHFGLWRLVDDVWQRIDALGNAHIVDLFPFEDGLAIMSRDGLWHSSDLQEFKKVELPLPVGEEKQVSLFKTLWEHHSGEAFGLPGKLAVDIFALVFCVLAIGGLVRYVLLKYLKKGRAKGYARLYRINRVWHIKLGVFAGIILIAMTVTGMFLRPPLLIPIANIKVSPIPNTGLDSPNPWADSLRKGFYDGDRLIFSTSDGVYSMEDGVVERFVSQPPISVMGATVFQKEGENEYLIGSFSGLFLWNTKTGIIINVLTGKRAENSYGRPTSSTMVTGIIEEQDGKAGYFLDYNKGVRQIGSAKSISLPEEFAQNAKISLWNLALEIHTARIFEPLLGLFYLLYIPLSGMLVLFVLISGYWWWAGKTKR